MGLVGCLSKYHRDMLTECITLMIILNERNLHCVMGSN